jgi:hypothetical protein
MNFSNLQNTTASILVLCSLVFYLNPAIAVSPKPISKQHTSMVTLTKGTQFIVQIDSDFESITGQANDKITAVLTKPLTTQSGLIVLPVGTRLIGTLQKVESAGRFSKSGSITARFNTALLPDTRKASLSAVVSTTDGSGKLTSSEAPSRIGATLTPMLKGAIAGVAIGTLATLAENPKADKSKVIKNGAIGAGVTGGIGLLVGAFKKGTDIGLEKGKIVSLVLDAPFSFRP